MDDDQGRHVVKQMIAIDLLNSMKLIRIERRGYSLNLITLRGMFLCENTANRGMGKFVQKITQEIP